MEELKLKIKRMKKLDLETDIVASKDKIKLHAQYEVSTCELNGNQ